MNWNQQAVPIDPERAGQLDRLVGGELDEQSRGSLIAWLDEDPRRWRVCGLLFLEAQTWSQSMADWPPEMDLEKRTDRGPETSAARRKAMMPNRWPSIVYGATLAASIVVSFLAGVAARSGSRATSSDAQIAHDADALPHADRMVIATLPVESSAGAFSTSTVHIPLVRGQTVASEVRGASADIPDYIRQQWRRRGYELNVQRRYLFAQLPDGERVAVPVDQYSFTHVPPKIN